MTRRYPFFALAVLSAILLSAERRGGKTKGRTISTRRPTRSLLPKMLTIWRR